MHAAVIKQYVNEAREPIAINAIQVLNEMGFTVELVSSQRSNLENLWRNSGRRVQVDKYTTFLPFSFRDTFVYDRFLTMFPCLRLRVDIGLDMHGDLPAYYLPKNTPLLIYCFFPLPAYLSDRFASKFQTSALWRAYLQPYRALASLSAKRSQNRIFMLTLSTFSQAVIEQTYGLHAHILYPPIDVERFSRALRSDAREENILVFCRIAPEKNIELALEVIRHLSRYSEGWSMTIIGSLTPWNKTYFEGLRQKATGMPVVFKLNAPFTEVFEAMAKSKVYLHTMRGEHFGISIAEAMSAGLIPIVPNFGGQTDFVPTRFRYSSVEEAASTVEKVRDVPFSDRVKVSEIAGRFSEESYRQRLRREVELVLEGRWREEAPAKA